MKSLIYLNRNLIFKKPLILILIIQTMKVHLLSPQPHPSLPILWLSNRITDGQHSWDHLQNIDTYGACLIALLWHLFKNVTFLMRNHHHLFFMTTKWKSSSYTHSWARTKGHHFTPKIMSTSLLRLLPL